MTDDFEMLCQIPAIKAIHDEAVALAPSLGGDPDRIKEVWRGKDGMQARIAGALGSVGLSDEEVNRAYDAACKGLWTILWARRLGLHAETKEGI